MSRVGKKPVVIPKGVSADIAGGNIKIKGPKGFLERGMLPGIQVKVDGNQIVVERDNEHQQTRAFHGLMRALLQNMVTGVADGWTKKLEIVGVGYSAEVTGQSLTLKLGFSHPVAYAIPAGVQVNVEKGNQISVHGIDRQAVGQVAAVIRGFRKPDAYKGKGIRYKGEMIKLKPGKAGVTA